MKSRAGGIQRAIWVSSLQAIVLYASMCLIAPLLAAVYVIAGGWAFVSFMVPLMLGREALARAERLHAAAGELKRKNEAIRRTTESVSDESATSALHLRANCTTTFSPPCITYTSWAKW